MNMYTCAFIESTYFRSLLLMIHSIVIVLQKKKKLLNDKTRIITQQFITVEIRLIYLIICFSHMWNDDTMPVCYFSVLLESAKLMQKKSFIKSYIEIRCLHHIPKKTHTHKYKNSVHLIEIHLWKFPDCC
jgi:hypothetical protein